MASADTIAGAVFISYASQDAAAARRIAEALRTASIEVWLDEAELHSGDEWDACIRQQIRACTLFMPIISANTQARREGYFRREWHFAAERTLDIARGVPFLVPVVIDETKDRAALVPEEFLRVQWTRLPDGTAPADFAARVRALMGVPHPSPSPGADLPGAARAPKRPQSGRNRLRIYFAATLGVVLVALAGWRWQTNGGLSSDRTAASSEPSIAVLAFANLSRDADNEYFSDGISEELLNTLARVPGVRVAARTSAFSFKGKNVPVTEITRKLGVNYALEGTVRRDGAMVRITAELIKAADGFHAWSGRYDKELKDIFAVQEEIAQAIVSQLRGTLLRDGRPPTGVPAVHIAARTRNPRAYEEFLQGRFFLNRATAADFQPAVAHLQAAIELDPDFAPTWADLGRVYSNTAQFGLGPLSYTQAFAEVRTAAERALKLDPDLAYGHMLRAHVQMVHDWDVAAANRSIARALELAPGDASVTIVAAMMRLFVGDQVSALEFARRAAALDPVNPQVRVYLAVVHFYCGQLVESETEIRRALELQPKVVLGPSMLSYVCLLRGRIDEALTAGADEAAPHLRLVPLALAYEAQHNRAASDAALKELMGSYREKMAMNVAQIYAFRGEVERAFEWLDRACALHDSALVHAKLDPFLRNLHGDPRWAQFLRRIGLAEPGAIAKGTR